MDKGYDKKLNIVCSGLQILDCNPCADRESKGAGPSGRVWRGFKGGTKVLSRLWRLNFMFKRSANALLAFVAIFVYAFAGSPLLFLFLYQLFLWCLPSGQTLSKRSTEYDALFLAAFAHFCPYRKEGPARPERKGRILQ